MNYKCKECGKVYHLGGAAVHGTHCPACKGTLVPAFHEPPPKEGAGAPPPVHGHPVHRRLGTPPTAVAEPAETLFPHAREERGARLPNLHPART
jgi:predicted  nucleic acid-binding Zn-ribbon protein